ncbi:MAG: hypothetical protein OSB14_07355, partial [Planctomycetota bacterium]|nr:hypothetical protein [Planctomycetota bacterium]
MTNEVMKMSETEEPVTYSKDYLDLVLEQLAKRRLFRGGMAVLALLYGLAIFAPLIGNDRPVKLVAIDYGAYERAVQGTARLSTIALDRLNSTGDDLPERARLAER